MWRFLIGFLFLTFKTFAAINSAKNTTIHQSVELLMVDDDVKCKFQPNKYDCTPRNVISTSYYYDIKMQDCKLTKTGNCPYNLNQFRDMTSCHKACKEAGLRHIKANLTRSVYCRLQPDFGLCNRYYPSWYYDMTIAACRGFSYSGCGGNMNRFSSAQICMAVCGHMNE